MLKKLIALSFLSFQMVFLVTPIFAQSPDPVPSTEQDDLNDSNVPIDTEVEDIIGPIGQGTAGEQCRTEIKLEKEKLIDNLDFNIPLVPRWVERRFFNSFINSMGGTDILLNDIAKQINTIGAGDLCTDGSTPSTTDEAEIAKGNCVCSAKMAFKPETDFCGKLHLADEQKECVDCAKKGMWTAVGCIDYDFKAFLVNIVFKMGIGLGGLVALGCIIYASVLLQVSRGDAENIQHARELITSCILGLILIIFSIFILEFIGVSLLNLGEFGAKIGS